MMACLDVPQQLRRQDEAKENIDRQHEDEVGHVIAQRRPAPVRPVLDYPIRDLGHAEQVEAEAKQPFRVHVVDDGVRDLLRIRERLRCSPVAQLAHHSLHHGVKIHAIQG